MKQISAQAYIDGVLSIYEEKPSYKLGHDGSDGECDCIGMCRGGLKRGGATDVSGMPGTNYAARFTIKDLAPIKKEALKLGDVVLKTRPPDDPDMPLPDRYRPGGKDYTGNETNYTHIGTVTRENPLEITHMTSPTAKQDTKIGNWAYMGRLPWIIQAQPGPQPEPEIQTAVVYSENGKPVKIRAKPSTASRLYWEVPCGTVVVVEEPGEEWSRVSYGNISGWMMSRFLRYWDSWTVTIPGLTKEQAETLVDQYPGATMKMG